MLDLEAIVLTELADGRRGTREPHRRAASNGVVLFEIDVARMDFTRRGGVVAAGRYDRFGSEVKLVSCFVSGADSINDLLGIHRNRRPYQRESATEAHRPTS